MGETSSAAKVQAFLSALAACLASKS